MKNGYKVFKDGDLWFASQGMLSAYAKTPEKALSGLLSVIREEEYLEEVNSLMKGIEEARKRKSLSQGKVASAIGVTTATYCRWVQGNHTPCKSKMESIKKALQTL